MLLPLRKIARFAILPVAFLAACSVESRAQATEFPPDIQAQPADTAAPQEQRPAPPQSDRQVAPAARPATPQAPAATATHPAAKATARSGKKKLGKETTQPVAQLPPPPPPTPAQLPPTRPRVAYQNGLLSVDAENATLFDVLSAIRSRAALAIDIPGSASGERVFFHAGPGPVRDVVASLLNGSRFSFVILGSERSPDVVQRVIVTQRAPEGGAQPPLPSFGDNSSDQGGQDAEIPDREIEDNAQQPPPQQPAAQPAGGAAAPNNGGRPQFPPMPLGQPNGQQQGNQGQNAQQPNTQNQQPKTPEQLLEELKKMQQQQQQQKPPQ